MVAEKLSTYELRVPLSSSSKVDPLSNSLAFNTITLYEQCIKLASRFGRIVSNEWSLVGNSEDSRRLVCGFECSTQGIFNGCRKPVSASLLMLNIYETTLPAHLSQIKKNLILLAVRNSRLPERGRVLYMGSEDIVDEEARKQELVVRLRAICLRDKKILRSEIITEEEIKSQLALVHSMSRSLHSSLSWWQRLMLNLG